MSVPFFSPTKRSYQIVGDEMKFPSRTSLSVIARKGEEEIARLHRQIGFRNYTT